MSVVVCIYVSVGGGGLPSETNVPSVCRRPEALHQNKVPAITVSCCASGRINEVSGWRQAHFTPEVSDESNV